MCVETKVNLEYHSAATIFLFKIGSLHGPDLIN